MTDPRIDLLRQGNLNACRPIFTGRSQVPIGGVPPLGWAVESGSIRMVKWFLRQPQVSVDDRDDKGQTPLLRVLGSDSALGEAQVILMVMVLMRNGADPLALDRQGTSPHSLAVRYFPDLLTLLQRGRQEKRRPPVTGLSHATPWVDPAHHRRSLLAWSAATGAIFMVAVACVGLRAQPESANLKPQDPPAWIVATQLAQKAHDMGDAAGTASFARQALEVNPKAQIHKAQAYMLRMDALAEQKNLSAAVELLADYQRRGPRTPQLEARMAESKQQLDRIGQTEISNYLALGQTALAADEISRAKNCLNEAEKVCRILGLAAAPVLPLQTAIEQRQIAMQQHTQAGRDQHHEALRAEAELERTRHPFRQSWQTAEPPPGVLTPDAWRQWRNPTFRRRNRP